MNYYDNDKRVDVLRDAALEWIGTPWMPNSDVPGVGVSCHNLPRAILVKAGAISESFPKITGDPNASRHTKNNRMASFLDSRPEFKRVTPSFSGAMDIQPGDVIGIRIYHCVDHLGLVLTDGWFIHVLMHKHTAYDMIRVPPWLQRIEAVWRPQDERNYGTR